VSYDPRQWGARCDECPLKAQGLKPVPPKFAPHDDLKRGPTEVAPLVLVGDAPGPMEVKHRTTFAGPSSVKLSEQLWDINAPREVVIVSHALLCRPEVPEVEGRKRYELKGWLAWWRKENVRRKRDAKAWLAQFPDENPDGTPFVPPELPSMLREMPSPFECCYPRLKYELAWAEHWARAFQRQLVVMPMGSFALGAVSGKPGKSLGIVKYRGSVMTPEQGEKPEGKP